MSRTRSGATRRDAQSPPEGPEVSSGARGFQFPPERNTTQQRGTLSSAACCVMRMCVWLHAYEAASRTRQTQTQTPRGSSCDHHPQGGATGHQKYKKDNNDNSQAHLHAHTHVKWRNSMKCSITTRKTRSE